MFGPFTPFIIILLVIAGFGLLWWGFMQLTMIPPMIKTILIVLFGIIVIVWMINWVSSGGTHFGAMGHPYP
jgi:hypothetical protein